MRIVFSVQVAGLGFYSGIRIEVEKEIFLLNLVSLFNFFFDFF